MRFYEFKDITLREPMPCYPKRVANTPIPEPIKREWLWQRLTQQIAHQANVPQVTKGDVRVAVNRFKQQQKRANLDYSRQVRAQARAERARRKVSLRVSD